MGDVFISLTLFIIFNLRYGDQLGSLVLVDIGIWLALVYILSKLITKQGHIVLRQISDDQTNWFIRAFRNVNCMSEKGGLACFRFVRKDRD